MESLLMWIFYSSYLSENSLVWSCGHCLAQDSSSTTLSELKGSGWSWLFSYLLWLVKKCFERSRAWAIAQQLRTYSIFQLPKSYLFPDKKEVAAGVSSTLARTARRCVCISDAPVDTSKRRRGCALVCWLSASSLPSRQMEEVERRKILERLHGLQWPRDARAQLQQSSDKKRVGAVFSGVEAAAQAAGRVD